MSLISEALCDGRIVRYFAYDNESPTGIQRMLRLAASYPNLIGELEPIEVPPDVLDYLMRLQEYHTYRDDVPDLVRPEPEPELLRDCPINMDRLSNFVYFDAVYDDDGTADGALNVNLYKATYGVRSLKEIAMKTVRKELEGKSPAEVAKLLPQSLSRELKRPTTM